MSKQLPVKAFLQYAEGLELGSSPDVRRFKIARDDADDTRDLFNRLVDTLSDIFPEIRGVNFSLYWKDDEGDMVALSKLEELQTGLDAMTDRLFRVYVIVNFDDAEDTTEAESESEKEGKSKRVRFLRAGRRFRRKVRRRRRSALTDQIVVSKEFRMGARLLVRYLHEKAKHGAESLPDDEALSELSPEVRDFVQQIHDEWHTKLATQRPVVVARRMRMKERSFPPTIEKDHFLWLVRLMGRWHRRHAGLCKPMAGWSSGDTDADESADEGEALLRIARRKRRTRRARKEVAQTTQPLTEDEDEDDTLQHKVPKEFRVDVRTLMKQIHGKNKEPKPADDKEKTTLAVLTPEVQAFVEKMADDWHRKLGEKMPRRVAKRMRKRGKTLPEGVTRDHYLWLCRYFRRWHTRHAGFCPAMAGWSSGEEDEFVSEDEEKMASEAGKGGKGEKEKSSSSSSDSSSDEDKKGKRPPKGFIKGVRVLVNQLHHRNLGNVEKKEKPEGESDKSLFGALTSEVHSFIQTVTGDEKEDQPMSPEVKAFVLSFAEEWESKLTRKSPSVVARRMRRKKRDLPAGIRDGHVAFLCRFLSRWHEKNAVFCQAMAAWSSGESGGDTAAEEMSAGRRFTRSAGLVDDLTESEPDTDCIETGCKPVSKDFRIGVRQWINQNHKKEGKTSKPKDDKEGATPALPEEVQQFLKKIADDWHNKLTESGKRPRGVSKELKGSSPQLPASLQLEQFVWICCYMARWHRKHSGKCDVMSGRETAAA